MKQSCFKVLHVSTIIGLLFSRQKGRLKSKMAAGRRINGVNDALREVVNDQDIDQGDQDIDQGDQDIDQGDIDRVGNICGE